MRIQILILGLKWHYSTVRSKKTAAVLIEDAAFALFFRLTARNLAAEVSPSLGICNPRLKKITLGVSPGGMRELRESPAIIEGIKRGYPSRQKWYSRLPITRTSR